MRELAVITGLQIDNYVIIDMYAFIDVINILGGITVVLEEDLIDPTYRVRIDGVWQSLYYKKGIYTLNGVEALRVARARHYTPVLSRNRRQQQLIIGIWDKLTNLSIENAGKIYQLVKTIMKYVETDYTPFRIVEDYMAYRSYSLAGQIGLHVDNILYETYSNVYLLENEEIADDPSYDKGAWILLPQNNNWSLIHEFISSGIKGAEK